MLKPFLILALFLTPVTRVLALGADHPLDQPVYLSDAPEGLNALVNSSNRVHGFFVNATDHFFYAGDTASFDGFLKQYAALEGIPGHRLILLEGAGEAKSPWSDHNGSPCDWMLDVGRVSWRELSGTPVYRDERAQSPTSGEEVETLAEIHLWKHGNIDVAELDIPEVIEVVDETPEIRIYTPQEIVAKGEALKNEMVQVRVRFEVGAIGTVPTVYPDGSTNQVIHLVPHDIDGAFSCPISPDFQRQLHRIGITDPAAHFEGRTVTLEGYVSGTATMLILSPTIWTFHVSIHSFENLLSVESL